MDDSSGGLVLDLTSNICPKCCLTTSRLLPLCKLAFGGRRVRRAMWCGRSRSACSHLTVRYPLPGPHFMRFLFTVYTTASRTYSSLCRHEPSRLRCCRPVCAVRGHLHRPGAGPAHGPRAAAHAGGFPAPARPHQLWAAARGAAAPAGRASRMAHRGRPAAARRSGLARNWDPW